MLDLQGNKVAITPIVDPDVSEGGIIIPEIAKERADQGIVKYVGPNVRYLKPGDYVLFSGYAGVKIWLEGEGAFIICFETEIQAILYDEPTTLTNVYFRAPDGTYFQATYEMVHEVLVRDISQSTWYQRNKEKYISRENRYHRDESVTTRTEHRRKNEISESNPMTYDTYETRGDYEEDANEEKEGTSTS
jgi:co-chaperonin GroES (HSP10)